MVPSGRATPVDQSSHVETHRSCLQWGDRVDDANSFMPHQVLVAGSAVAGVKVRRRRRLRRDPDRAGTIGGEAKISSSASSWQMQQYVEALAACPAPWVRQDSLKCSWDRQFAQHLLIRTVCHQQAYQSPTMP